MITCFSIGDIVTLGHKNEHNMVWMYKMQKETTCVQHEAKYVQHEATYVQHEATNV